MSIHLRDQTDRLGRHLEAMKAKSAMPYDRSLLQERSASMALPQGAWDGALALLLAYDIFPPRVLVSLTQWKAEGRAMRVGDTIVQQVSVPPLGGPSVKLICGTRIFETMDEPDRRGFAYETLEGHVERGCSYFALERSDRETVFRIRTFSEPAAAPARWTAPMLAQPLQAYCTRLALQHTKNRAR